jgi:hypothetical protein
MLECGPLPPGAVLVGSRSSSALLTAKRNYRGSSRVRGMRVFKSTPAATSYTKCQAADASKVTSGSEWRSRKRSTRFQRTNWEETGVDGTDAVETLSLEIASSSARSIRQPSRSSSSAHRADGHYFRARCQSPRTVLLHSRGAMPLKLRCRRSRPDRNHPRPEPSAFYRYHHSAHGVRSSNPRLGRDESKRSGRAALPAQPEQFR